MVTARTGSDGLSSLGKKGFSEAIALFGREDITLTTHTFTTNQNGRLATKSETTSTITGDLQYVSLKDRQWINLGYAKVGDGVFYTFANVTIIPGDHITVDGVNWDVSKQVEGETINGNLVYQGWIVTRIEED